MATNIVFIVYPGIKLLDLAGPLQVFSDANNEQGKPAYKTFIVSKNGGELHTDTTVCISSDSLSKWKNRKIDTLLVVGGDGVYNTLEDSKFIKKVRTLALKSRRVAAICSGAFILAESGLLNGRRAVTHWESCNRLRDSYPEISVAEDSIYVTDGKYWTSAGVTAGIDMAIKMISNDLGKTTGLSIARSLVTYLVRPGGQSQFSESLSLQLSDSAGRFEDINSWIQSHLSHDLSIQKLADRACMSTRTFARLYKNETGISPAKAIESMRVEVGCRRLIKTNINISKVARRCGFVDDERMRRAFSRQVNTTPSDYRSRFSVNN